jgi:predicted CoA-substrate-specific enzyme activase
MIFAGIDVGAQSAKIVILKNGKIAHARVVVTEEEGEVVSERLIVEALDDLGLSREEVSYVVATGVGSNTVRFSNKRRSEELCHAQGARWLFDSARTVLDIGAGGMRAMKLDAVGKVTDFVVNSKCAAGTGAFLEAMTKIIHVPIEEMGTMAVGAKKKAKVSSYCTVFAESEVISNIHRGMRKEDIVAGIHEAVVDRAVELLNGVGIHEDLVVTGGVAKNVGVIDGLQNRTGIKMKVPRDPQIVGALGAALMAQGANLSPK